MIGYERITSANESTEISGYCFERVLKHKDGILGISHGNSCLRVKVGSDVSWELGFLLDSEFVPGQDFHVAKTHPSRILNGFKLEHKSH